MKYKFTTLDYDGTIDVETFENKLEGISWANGYGLEILTIEEIK